MQPPADPLSPPDEKFTEPWHAQTLATARALVEAGHVTPKDWANALGEALAEAANKGAPDSDDTYFRAALSALETVAPLTAQDLSDRKSAWEAAYARTPHGKPVTL